jgi:Peptidase family M1 domain
MKVRRAAAFLALLLCVGATPRAQDEESVRQFLSTLERAVQAGDTAAYFGLLGPSANREAARDFAGTEIMPGASRAAMHERDRKALQGAPAGSGYSLLVEVIAEFGSRARIATWRVDIKRTGQAGTEHEWTIAGQERLSAVENIYRVSLNASKAFAARNLKIAAEDLDLTLPEGSVYVGDIDVGVTAVVLLGRGMLNFHPAPATEKGQVKIFCGSDTLETRFDVAFIRINPADFDEVFDQSALQPKQVDAGEMRRAQEVFREESQKSFVIDLGDLSRDAWTLLPSQGDLLAELRTRRFDTLTYARSSSEAEDITLFDRKRHKNIALYPSQEKAVRRGQASYNEDDLVDYDVLSYDIDVAATPDRQWIDGRATLRLKVRAYVLGTLMLRLADPLVVQSIISYEHGRLFGIRVKNQNTLVVNLPTTLARDNIITLTITYAGRLEPQAPERETIGPLEGQRASSSEDVQMMLVAEPSYLYSSRSYWYPQAPVSDYATARIHLSVPPGIDAVASGELEPGFPTMVAGKEPAQNRKLYVFTAAQPLRYLAFILSRFARAETSTIAFPDGPASSDGPDATALNGTKYHSLSLSVETNPRQVSRGRDLAERAAEIALFYESIVGDSPYSSFTVALIESDLPGGHSPGYFAALNQQLPSSGLVWRNDPAAFPNYPDFFIAHELAHQWWGQAVGWRNYHEQWLSEGFAQYFAAMYAQQQRGEEGFTSVLKQLRRWGMDNSDQGPISLGYRLGHIRGESRVFRALVYNKSAAVLHMLRRLVGDDAFFRGVRRFYREARFKKVGTQDFRAAMEKESGRDLERFFDRWIYGSTLPKLKVGYRVEGSEVVLHVEQIGEIFDVPVTVTLQYADRKAVDVLVPVTDRTVEQRAPLEGVLRGIDVSKDDGTMADIVKN